MVYLYHSSDKCEKTSHATKNMAICIATEISIACTMHIIVAIIYHYSAATYNIAQCKELCYSIMLIKYQANSRKSI